MNQSHPHKSQSNQLSPPHHWKSVLTVSNYKQYIVKEKIANLKKTKNMCSIFLINKNINNNLYPGIFSMLQQIFTRFNPSWCNSKHNTLKTIQNNAMHYGSFQNYFWGWMFLTIKKCVSLFWLNQRTPTPPKKGFAKSGYPPPYIIFKQSSLFELFIFIIVFGKIRAHPSNQWPNLHAPPINFLIPYWLEWVGVGKRRNGSD